MIGLSGFCLLAIFTTGYSALVVSVVWELRVKLSYQAARILQTNNPSSHGSKVLLLNLLQLLLSCGLVSTIKIARASPAPARDFVLGCLLLLLVKLLHLKRETVLPDLVGLSSLAFTALVCHQHLSSRASALETISSAVNLVVFCGPPTVILSIVMMAGYLTISVILGLLCLLYICLQQGRSKLVIIPFFILLIQFSSKHQVQDIQNNSDSQSFKGAEFQSQDIRNNSESQTVTGTDQPLENNILTGAKCENSLNDPGKYFTKEPPAFHETDRESPTTPTKVIEEEEEGVEIECSGSSSSSQRELTVLRSGDREGRCEVVALDLTGRAPLTKYLLSLASLLLPRLSWVSTVTLSLGGSSASLCSRLAPGAQIVSHLQNKSLHLLCPEQVILKQDSLPSQILSFLINARNSLLDQFL